MTAHHLFVGTIGEGVFRSTDGGVTFRRSMNGGVYVESHIRALVVHPDDPRTLYHGSEQGLFFSRDGADSWQPVAPLRGQQVWSILVWPGLPRCILVGACPSRLFRSDDAGQSWNEVTPGINQECPRIIWTRVTSLAAEPGGQNAWAGVEIDSAWHSADGGKTWKKSAQGLSSPDIHSLAVVPARMGKPRRILAATNNDLNISEDDAATWKPREIGKVAPRSYCRGMTQVIGKPERILLGIGDGPPGWTGIIVVSDDAGATWRQAAMPGPANSTIWTFATHAANMDLVYAASVSGQVYRSTDAGERWEKLPVEFGEIRALAWGPA